MLTSVRLPLSHWWLHPSRCEVTPAFWTGLVPDLGTSLFPSQNFCSLCVASSWIFVWLLPPSSLRSWLKHHLLIIHWLLAHSSLSTPIVLFFFTIWGIIMCIFMYYFVLVTRMTAHGSGALPCSLLYWIYLALGTVPGPESAPVNIARCKRKEWMSEDLADAGCKNEWKNEWVKTWRML